MGMAQSSSSADSKTRAKELRQKALQDLEERVLSATIDHDTVDSCNNIRSTSELGYQNKESPNQPETLQQSLQENVDIKDYDFPFENLIFEGGGNKGLAYIGCIRVLDL
ncbi:hypothetical protein Bpfe_009161 [Biomphalaria pfeifferi]|uniref:Uncharacterized protein n=1 Tax=Biomphalaria pfeifferi TaxID=112525 RepID=A0AAD8FEE0_BIOPF|nr:hypothetical protein Bpfe_009161 [Biomphalaria pfeifferi]